jgi:hypothetical protein
MDRSNALFVRKSPNGWKSCLCAFSRALAEILTDFFFFFFTLAEIHICEYGQAGRADPVSCLPNQHRNASFQSICTPTCRDLNAMSPKRKALLLFLFTDSFEVNCASIRWAAVAYAAKMDKPLPTFCWACPPYLVHRVLCSSYRMLDTKSRRCQVFSQIGSFSPQNIHFS